MEIEVVEVKVLAVVSAAKVALVVKDVKEDLEVSAVKVVSEEVLAVKEASAEVNVEKKERKVLVDLEVGTVTGAVVLAEVEVEMEGTLEEHLEMEVLEAEVREVQTVIEVLEEVVVVLESHLTKEKVVFKK